MEGFDCQPRGIFGVARSGLHSKKVSTCGLNEDETDAKSGDEDMIWPKLRRGCAVRADARHS